MTKSWSIDMDGNLLWSKSGFSYVYRVKVHGDRIIAATAVTREGRNLYELSIDEGKVLKSFRVGEGSAELLDVSYDGTIGVFVNTQNSSGSWWGEVYIVKNGGVISSKTWPSPIYRGCIRFVGPDELAVPDYNGFVGVLDSTGRVSLLSVPSTLAVFYNGRDLASVTNDRVFIFSNTQGQQAESSGSQDNALPSAMTQELQLNFTPRSVLMIRENLLIVGSEYPDASVYILAPGASPLRIPLTSSVYALAPANDGFYVGGSDVEKFDFSGNLIWKYETHSTVNSLSGKGNLVAVGALSGIYLLSSEGEKLWGVSFPEDGFDRYPSVSLAGDVVFSTVIQRDGAWLWKIRNGNIIWKKHVSSSMILSLTVSDNGRYVAFGDIRGNIGIMDSGGSLIKTIHAGESVNDLAVLRVGKWQYLLARTREGTVKIYLLPLGIQVDEIEAGSATSKPGVSLSVSPDKGSVALLERTPDGGVLRVLPLPNLQNIALLSVESTPPGAMVVVDGHYEGRTPINVTVSPGNHTIKTTLSGYASAEVSLSLMPQERKTVHLKLVKDGFLTVETSPSGVEVYLNGTYIGTTPLEGYTVPPGRYSLVLRKEGYMEHTKTLTVSSGNETRISVSMQPLSSPTSSASSIPPTSTSPKVTTTGKTSGGKSTSENNPGTTRTSESVPDYPNGGQENSTRANVGITLYIGIAFVLLILSVVVFKLTKKKTKETSGLDFPSALLPRYEPIEFLGEGGFAKVFKAKRKKDGKVVALKIPRIDEKTSKTFIREASTWLHLDHPNIVKLYDVDILPVPYLEMEYVEGITLDEKTVRNLDAYPKPVDEKTALNLIKGIAEGLRHAHSKGVYHRDLKPLNILLKSDLRPKITDWGLAKLGTMSSSRSVMGYTPLYAAPEHLMPSKYGHTDARTDIWQLGVTFYELLTGKLPFEGYTYEEVFGKIVDEDYKFTPPSKINPGLAKYDGIFERLLAKKKEDRYPSVDDFLNDLKNLEESEKRKAELEVEVEKLKKSLSESMTALKKSTSAEEIMRNRRIVVETLGKLALTYAELNRKAELLNTLNDLKFYTVQNLGGLSNAISTVEALIRENLPVKEDFIERLKVLVHSIKRENEGRYTQISYQREPTFSSRSKTTQQKPTRSAGGRKRDVDKYIEIDGKVIEFKDRTGELSPDEMEKLARDAYTFYMNNIEKIVQFLTREVERKGYPLTPQLLERVRNPNRISMWKNGNVRIYNHDSKDQIKKVGIVIDRNTFEIKRSVISR